MSYEQWKAEVLIRPGAREHIDQLVAEFKNAPVNLWLDDLRPAPDTTWRHVKTAQEAIHWLQRSFFDVVSLDHDLGPPEAGTGYDVLVWLERAVVEGDWRTPVPELRIHSANPVGRANMARAIESIRRLASQ
jgi:hypothetical protein